MQKAISCKIIITFYTFSLFHLLHAHEKAVICVPVADLVGQPLKTLYAQQKIHDSYNNIPICWKDNPLYSCPRLHQQLYNDIVEVISTEDDEACVQTHHIFYITPTSQTPQTTYWTHTKNLRLLSDITAQHIDINHIPQPLSFHEKNKTPKQHIITLTEPHYDSTTQCTFSAGTRFVCIKKPIPKQKELTVFAIDYNNNTEIIIPIPKNKCLLCCSATNPVQQINQFVELLKSWAHQKDSFIPYVWGGTSFTTYLNDPFREITKNINGHTFSFFEFDNDTTYPKSGFDCSGLIARAAQICNIPYFYKNTTTIGHYLQQLQPQDTLINGDLILIKGHVMVISDKDKNLLIEARSYGHGYGKVHEIELNTVFDGIETYQDLLNALFNKRTLHRKDIHGHIRDSSNDWKILKMLSTYQ